MTTQNKQHPRTLHPKASPVKYPNAMPTKEAAEYLCSIGYRTTHKSLEVYRCKKKGPKYKKVAGRIFYVQTWLDNYVEGLEVKIIDPSKMQEATI